MIQRGANPHVLDHDGDTDYNMYSFDSVTNIPTVKSIFFPIKSFSNGNLGRPFHYENGVYPGQFCRVVGKGAEGVVIEGIWNNEKAAFKFVQVRNPEFGNMNARVREMLEMGSTIESNILKFNGHFR